jgi:hypothetical protein
MAVTSSRSYAWLAAAGFALVATTSRPASAEDPAPATRPAAAAEPTAAPAAGGTLLAAATAAAQTAAAAAQTTEPQPAATPAPEAAKFPVTGGVTFDLMSHYVWRGQLLTDDFAFQPTVWGKFGDIMVSSWSSISPDQEDGSYREHDFTVDYTRAVHPKVNLSVGYINYYFPPGDGSFTNEFYGVAAFVAPLNPTVKAYFDVDEGSGTYLNFGISHPIPLGDSKITATPSFAIGYNFKQWIDDNTWNDANFGLKLTIPVHAKVSLAPAIYYSKGLTENYDDLIPDKFYGGLTVAIAF